MEYADIDCLVPAAGRSARMGAWKPTLPFGDSTIIGTVVAAALRVCARVILVTGYRGNELCALFGADPRVTTVENPDWELGIFSSIQRGATQVRTERFFVALGDMPWIPPRAFAALRDAPAADALFPTFNGQRGHPVLFSARIIPALRASDPAAGSMREIAARFSVAELPWPDETILRDIDTMEDYR